MSLYTTTTVPLPQFPSVETKTFYSRGSTAFLSDELMVDLLHVAAIRHNRGSNELNVEMIEGKDIVMYLSPGEWETIKMELLHLFSEVCHYRGQVQALGGMFK